MSSNWRSLKILISVELKSTNTKNFNFTPESEMSNPLIQRSRRKYVNYISDKNHFKLYPIKTVAKTFPLPYYTYYPPLPLQRYHFNDIKHSSKLLPSPSNEIMIVILSYRTPQFVFNSMTRVR